MFSAAGISQEMVDKYLRAAQEKAWKQLLPFENREKKAEGNECISNKSDVADLQNFNSFGSVSDYERPFPAEVSFSVAPRVVGIGSGSSTPQSNSTHTVDRDEKSGSGGKIIVSHLLD